MHLGYQPEARFKSLCRVVTYLVMWVLAPGLSASQRFKSLQELMPETLSLILAPGLSASQRFKSLWIGVGGKADGEALAPGLSASQRFKSLYKNMPNVKSKSGTWAISQRFKSLADS